MTRRLCLLLAGLMLSLTASAWAVLPPSGAMASPGCSYDNCNGLSPSDQGCTADAYPIAFVIVGNTQPGPEADIYYSPGCHAVWGECCPALKMSMMPALTVRMGRR